VQISGFYREPLLGWGATSREREREIRGGDVGSDTGKGCHLYDSLEPAGKKSREV
jgi:hypothetical protein